MATKALSERARRIDRLTLDPQNRRQRTARGRGRVYLLWAEYTSMFKIGYTAGCVGQRAVAIESCSPIRLRVIGDIPGTYQTERQWHKTLQQFRAHGEWFDLPESITWQVFRAFGLALPPDVTIYGDGAVYVHGHGIAE